MGILIVKFILSSFNLLYEKRLMLHYWNINLLQLFHCIINIISSPYYFYCCLFSYVL